MEKMECVYQVHTMDEVVHHFAKGFKLPENQEIANYQYWFDPSKGVVIFRLFTKEKTKIQNMKTK